MSRRSGRTTKLLGEAVNMAISTNQHVVFCVATASLFDVVGGLLREHYASRLGEHVASSTNDGHCTTYHLRGGGSLTFATMSDVRDNYTRWRGRRTVFHFDHYDPEYEALQDKLARWNRMRMTGRME